MPASLLTQPAGEKGDRVAHELDAEGYVFWGGREGYSSLWNTDMKREVDHLAKFLHMAVDHKKQIGLAQGSLLHRRQNRRNRTQTSIRL